MQIRRRKTAKLGIKQVPQIRSPSHRQWVRGHECVVQNADCLGRIEAAHVRAGTDCGLGVKPSDIFVIALCSWHHRQQHNIGEKQFQFRHKINMLEIAEEFARRSPHRAVWEGKEEAA